MSSLQPQQLAWRTPNLWITTNFRLVRFLNTLEINPFRKSMKLQDLVPVQKGTYVGLRVLEPSASQIYKYCKDAGIPIKRGSKDRRLHTTVLYSKKPCPGIQVESTQHLATATSYAIFNNSSGEPKVLVVRINAPSIVARHLQLMAEHKASYDYPTYEPHITLAHDYGGVVQNLPIISFPILLGEEYVQDLRE